MKAIGPHKVGQPAGTTYARDQDDLFWGEMSLEKDLIKCMQNGIITAEGTPHRRSPSPIFQQSSA